MAVEVNRCTVRAIDSELPVTRTGPRDQLRRVAEMPPSTYRVMPCTIAASSEAR